MNLGEIRNVKFCPICEREMFEELFNKTRCVNGCYTIDIWMNGFYITIFEPERDNDDLFEFGHLGYYDQSFLEKEKDRLVERIKYWRENYRYLAEILTR